MNNADWGVDYYDRTGTAKSNMFDNKPNETQYFYTDNDFVRRAARRIEDLRYHLPRRGGASGQRLLVADALQRHHFFYPNDLGRYSLGKDETLQRNEDGSLTLYAGATSPGDDKESNWLPAPDGTFSLYIWAYWGKERSSNGTWQPPEIKVVQ